MQTVDLRFIDGTQDLPLELAPTLLRAVLNRTPYNQGEYKAIKRIIEVPRFFNTTMLEDELPDQRANKRFFAYLKAYDPTTSLSLILIGYDAEGAMNMFYHFMDRANSSDCPVSRAGHRIVIDLEYISCPPAPNATLVNIIHPLIQKLAILGANAELVFDQPIQLLSTQYWAYLETAFSQYSPNADEESAPYFWIMFANALNPRQLHPNIMCPRSRPIAELAYQLFSEDTQVLNLRVIQMLKRFAQNEPSPSHLNQLRREHRAHLSDFNRPERQKTWERIKALLKESWQASDWREYWKATERPSFSDDTYCDRKLNVSEAIRKLKMHECADFLKKIKLGLTPAIQQAQAERALSPDLDTSTHPDDLEFKTTCTFNAQQYFSKIRHTTTHTTKHALAYAPAETEPFSHVIWRAQRCGIDLSTLAVHAVPRASGRAMTAPHETISTDPELPHQFKYLQALSLLLTREELETHRADFQLYDARLYQTGHHRAEEIERLHQAHLFLCTRVLEKVKTKATVAEIKLFLAPLPTRALWILIAAASQRGLDLAQVPLIQKKLGTLAQEMARNIAPWTTDAAQAAIQMIIALACKAYVERHPNLLRFWTGATQQDKLAQSVLGQFFVYSESDDLYYVLPQYEHWNPLDLIQTALDSCNKQIAKTRGEKGRSSLAVLEAAIEEVARTHPDLIALNKDAPNATRFIFKPFQAYQDLFYEIIADVLQFEALQAAAKLFLGRFIVSFADRAKLRRDLPSEVMADFHLNDTENHGFILDYDHEKREYSQPFTTKKMQTILNALLLKWYHEGKTNLIYRFTEHFNSHDWTALSAYEKQPILRPATARTPPYLEGVEVFEPTRTSNTIRVTLSQAHRHNRMEACKKIGAQLLAYIEAAERADSEWSTRLICQFLSSAFCCSTKEEIEDHREENKIKLATTYMLFCQIAQQETPIIKDPHTLKYAVLFQFMPEFQPFVDRDSKTTPMLRGQQGLQLITRSR